MSGDGCCPAGCEPEQDDDCFALRFDAGLVSGSATYGGKVFLPLSPYTTDPVNITGHAGCVIAWTDYDQLYCSQLWRDGDIRLTIPVPDDEYVVHLHNAETTTGIDQPSERLFSVDINGQRYVTDWDLVADGGSGNVALVSSIPMTVTTGQLVIDLLQNVQNPKICGLEILRPGHPPLPVEREPICGNGLLEAGEACDTAGDSTDCDADCTVVECGDAYINTAAGEECEGSDNCDQCQLTVVLDPIDVVGPHEFWIHEHVVSGDWVGYVKFFDMREDLFTPVFSVLSDTSGGAFGLDSTSGLITVSNPGLVIPGATYTLRVRIEETGAQRSDLDVVIHVATSAQTVYLDADAPEGGDGSFAAPFNDLTDDIGIWSFEGGKVYLLKRSTMFYDRLRVENDDTSSDAPLVIGAYHHGPRPIINAGFEGAVDGIHIGTYNNVTPPPATHHVFIQNIELSNAGRYGMTNGQFVSTPEGHHDLTFLDVHLTTSTGTGIYWWSRNQHDFGLDHRIKLINFEVSNCAAAGTKLYAGGMELINFRSHHNDGSGIRMILDGPKLCRGCVAHDNAGAGYQLRSGDTTLEWFQAYNNGYYGVHVWYNSTGGDGEYPSSITRSNIVVRNGRSHGNDNSGVEVHGALRDVLVDSVDVYDNRGMGIMLGGFWDAVTHGPMWDATVGVTVRDSFVHENDEDGIYTYDRDGYKVYIEDVTIERNEIHDNGANAIRLEYTDGALIQDNVGSGNGYDGILEIQPVADIVTSGNTWGQ